MALAVRILLLLFNMLLAGTLFAQEQIEFYVGRNVATKTVTVKTGESAQRLIANFIHSELYEQGHIAAVVDSTVSKGHITKVYINKGNAYQWLNLRVNPDQTDVLRNAGMDADDFEGAGLNPSEFSGKAESVLKFYENRGYPFASLELKEIAITDSSVSAVIHADKGKLIHIDSIEIAGEDFINGNYIYGFTGIRPGDVYNQKLLDELPARLRDIPFMTVVKAPEIVYTQEATKLVLYIEKRKASVFDGVLGILPDDNQAGKYLITGDIRLRLLNAFGNGELIAASFKKLQTQTQDLRTEVNYPFISGTPVGVNGKLELYKRDTSFLNVFRQLALSYTTRAYNHIRGNVALKSATLLSLENPELLTKLPENADARTVLYGLGFHKERLDYRFNPRRGYLFDGDFATGTRTLMKHPQIPDTLYSSLKLVTRQYDLRMRTSFYIPFFSRNTFFIGTENAWIISPSLFRNELMRIGGLRSLRGFDEESIFASAYSIVTAEVRYLLEQNSYASLFWNGAYYETNLNDTFSHDTPWGFGAGFSFETKAGIFSLSYALGTQKNNPILLRNGKIHFGFTSFF